MILIHNKDVRPWQELYIATGMPMERIHFLEVFWDEQRDKAFSLLDELKREFNKRKKNEVDKLIEEIRFKLTLLEKELARERASHLQEKNDGARPAAPSPTQPSETPVVSEAREPGGDRK